MDSWYYEISYTVVHGQLVRHYWGIRRSLIAPNLAKEHFLNRCQRLYGQGYTENFQCILIREDDPRTKLAEWEKADKSFRHDRLRR